MFVMAWIVGIGIVGYRSLVKQKTPIWPGQVLAASGLYVGLAILAQYPPARATAAAFAWAVDAAVLLQILPGDTKQPSPAGWWPPTSMIPATQIFPGGAGVVTGAKATAPAAAPKTGSGRGAPTGFTGSTVKPYG